MCVCKRGRGEGEREREIKKMIFDVRGEVGVSLLSEPAIPRVIVLGSR